MIDLFDVKIMIYNTRTMDGYEKNKTNETDETKKLNEKRSHTQFTQENPYKIPYHCQARSALHTFR